VTGDAARRALRSVLGPGPMTPVRQLFADTDWAATAIGAPDTWQPTLRAAISTAMTSRFGMLVMAGPELVMVYNDGYAPLMGALHPAMGRPLPEVWADEWPLLAPLVEAVRTRQVANRFEDFFLVTSRNGFPEEAYFTYSYSPLLDPAGDVVGVLNTVIETTDQVLATRRLQLAQQLGQLGATRHGDLTEAAAAAVDVLAAHRPDVPFAGVFLLEQPADPRSRLVHRAGHGLGALPDVSAVPDAQSWLHAAMADDGPRTHQVDDEWGAVAAAPAEVGGGRVRTAVTLPLTPGGGAGPVGVLLLGLSPHLAQDAAFRTFQELVANQVAVVLGATLTHLAEQAAAAASRSLAEALQRSLLTEAVEPDHLEIVTRYRPATTAAAIGGDWYDAFLCRDGSTWVVVGDVAGHDQTAVATMAQVRNLLRGIAYGSPGSPAQVLGLLDEAMAGLGVGTLTSVIAVRVEQDAEQARTGTRRLRWSNAGHPPMVLLPRGGPASLVQAPVDLVLGVDPTSPRRDHEVDLRPGDGVLLCTDGLVERRSADLDQGTAWLLEAVSGLLDGPVAALCDRLLELVAHHADDDVALLALRAHPEDRPRPAEAGPERLPG